MDTTTEELVYVDRLTDDMGEIDKITLKMFHAVLVTSNIRGNFNSKLVIQNFAKEGLLVDPKIFNGLDVEASKKFAKHILDYMGTSLYAVSSRFYQSFEEVSNLTEEERFSNQIMHYASTYGGLEELRNNGGVWTPELLDILDIKNQEDRLALEGSHLTYITPIAYSSLEERVVNMVTSNRALSEDDIENLSTLMDSSARLTETFESKLQSGAIKNREMSVILYKKFNVVPKDFDEFTRYLVYLTTGETQVVKNNQLLQDINDYNVMHNRFHNSLNKAITTYVKEQGIEEMARNITRYRDIYMMFKHSKVGKAKTYINKALRLSKKLYQPRKKPYLDSLAEHPYDAEAFKEALSKASVYKLAKVINYLWAKRDVNLDNTEVYKIRNGKTFVKETSFTPDLDKLNLFDGYRVLAYEEMMDRFKHLNGATIVVPDYGSGIDVAFPTSGKDFLGDVPVNTKVAKFKQEDTFTVGIYWDKDMDLDLHATTVDGRTLGWNEDYYSRGHGDESIRFSGDMTGLNNQGYASEAFEVRNLQTPFLLSLNVYTNWDGGNPTCKVYMNRKDAEGHETPVFSTRINCNDIANQQIMLVNPYTNILGSYTEVMTIKQAVNSRSIINSPYTRKLAKHLASNTKDAFTMNWLFDLLDSQSSDEFFIHFIDTDSAEFIKADYDLRLGNITPDFIDRLLVDYRKTEED